MISLESIRHKVENNIRINDDEALFLFQSPDLFEVGRIADLANQKKNADTVFYNVNRHINPTNICVMTCKFCAYSRKPGQEGAYEYSIEEMVEKAREAVKDGAKEVHLVGGLHPRWKVDKYIDILKSIKAEFPDLHIKAFTAVEIDWLSKKARKSHRDLLIEFKEAGLDSLPGGGAEIFHQDIRDEICAKLSAEEWIGIHNIAHELGMKSNCTMLYGHVETFAHRVDHLRHLREQQDKTKGFNAFIPLSFQPENNEMGIERYTFGVDDLKTLAVSRIYLDNFTHIKAYWIMLGQSIAQLALNFGANDLDGTVTEEKISNMAGSQSGKSMTRSQLEQLITRARKDAVERDTLYNPIGALKKSKIHRELTPTSTLELLKKTVNNEELSDSEWLEIANQGRFHDLVNSCTKITSQSNNYFNKTLNLAVKTHINEVKSPSELLDAITAEINACQSNSCQYLKTIILDLSDTLIDDMNLSSLSSLAESIVSIKEKFPGKEVGLSGLKGLWLMAQRDHLSLDKAFDLLAQVGISTVESSPQEREASLTNSELLGIHRAAHRAGINTIGKATISIPLDNSEPMWESFLEKLKLFKSLALESGKLLAICIEPGKTNFTTASEYLEAVAFAKLFLKDSLKIIAPLTRLPVMNAKRNENLRYHPAEKISPLTLLVGADDVGRIFPNKIKVELILEDIRSAGFNSKFRDINFNQVVNNEIVVKDSIRHIPELVHS